MLATAGVHLDVLLTSVSDGALDYWRCKSGRGEENSV